MTPTNKRYSFGDFELDTERRLLFKSGEAIGLKPKAFDLLATLVENRDRVVSKNDLLDRVWENQFVEENNITVHIAALRKALGETKKDNRFILTVPGTGYQFVAPINEQTNGDIIIEHHKRQTITVDEEIVETDPAGATASLAALPAWAHRQRLAIAAGSLIVIAIVAAVVMWNRNSPVAPQKPQGIAAVTSIAVLPFQFVSGEGDEGLQMGLTESLINRLSILNNIAVRPIGAVKKYPQGSGDFKTIGEELQVDSVLEGNIQRDGSRIRITVRLLGTRDGKSIWNEQIDEDFAGIFAVQDKISNRVANSLQIALSDNERSRLSQSYTTSIDAYKKYLAARHHWNKRDRDGFYESIKLYNQAIDLDPVFALAFAGMADTYLLIGLYAIEPTTDAFPKARAAALRALAIDPEMAEAYVALAMIENLFEYDWRKAEEHFKRAVELRPGYATGRHWFGLFLAMHGRTDEALGHLSHAQTLDPLSPSVSTDVAFAYYLAGQFDNSIHQLNKSLALNADFANAHNLLGMNYVALERFDEAFVELETAKRLSDGHFGTYELIWANAFAGKKDEARMHLDALPKNKKSPPFDMALVFVSLGENDKAIDFLTSAYEQRDPQLAPVLTYPPLRPLHGEPRFIELLNRMNL